MAIDQLPASTIRLDEVITELGVSRSEFGQSIGLSGSAVGHIFSRKQSVPEVWTWAIEGRHQISREWLLEGKGPKKIQKMTAFQQLKLRLSADFSPDLTWLAFEEFVRNSWLGRRRLGPDQIFSDFENYAHEVDRATRSKVWSTKYSKLSRDFEKLLEQTKEAFLSVADETILDSYDQFLLLSVLLDGKKLNSEMISAEKLDYAKDLVSKHEIDEYIQKFRAFADLRYRLMGFFEPPVALKEAYIQVMNEQKTKREENILNRSGDFQQYRSIGSFLKLSHCEEVVEDSKRNAIFRKKLEIRKVKIDFQQSLMVEDEFLEKKGRLETELKQMIVEWKKESGNGNRS